MAGDARNALATRKDPLTQSQYGWSAFTDGYFGNQAIKVLMPERLRTHALVAAAWQGLDAASVWDVHCHVFGNGDSGSGLWINPLMERIWQPQQYLQRMFYLNAGCVHDSPGKVDAKDIFRCSCMATRPLPDKALPPRP